MLSGDRITTVLQSIRRYLAAPVTLTVVAVICAFYIGQLASGTWYGEFNNLRHALGFSLRDVARWQWWRLVTPNLTNGPSPPDIGPPGLTHLFNNVLGLLVVGPTVERALGRARYVLVLLVGGAVSYGWLVVPRPVDAFLADGTSGALFAVGGALLSLVILHPPKQRLAWIGLGIIAIGGILGFAGKPLITIRIHGGGVIAGFVLGLFFQSNRSRRTVIAAASLMTLSLLAVVAVRSVEFRTTDARVGRATAVGEFPNPVWNADGVPVVGVRRPASVVLVGRRRLALPEPPDDVIAAARRIWVTTEARSLHVFSAAGHEDARIDIGPSPHALTFDGSSVWVTSRGRVSRINPKTLRRTAVVTTGASAYAAAVLVDGTVCLSDYDHFSVVCVDPRKHQPRRFPVGGRSFAMASSGDVLFVSAGRNLARITPSSGTVKKREVRGSPFNELAVDRRGRIWATKFVDRHLVAISPSSLRILDTVRLGLTSPAGFALTEREIWVSDYWGGQLVRVLTS